MIEAITSETIGRIKNAAFRRYAETYVEIDADFRRQIAEYGLPISDEPRLGVGDERVAALAAQGLEIANDGKSLHTGWISPSCVVCRKGLGTATYLISVQCPRNCYFCFNPNQLDYEYYLHHTHDVVAELDAAYHQGARYRDLALTGGEPLLHKAETEAFFRHANELFPGAYTRLYTSGALLDEAFLRVLRELGLDEIRFSIKTDDSLEQQEATLARIAMSKAYIPNVMVEMPVLPDNLEQMKDLLLRLDALEIAGVNLLEFCFPLHNAQEFSARGYEIKATQLRVLYNYWYAGGLPIAGSEENCLLLLAFALERHLSLGVHYCSLENKFTGQIYLQNNRFRTTYAWCTMSERDHFLKSAKVFGGDMGVAEAVLARAGLPIQRRDEEGLYLEFPVVYLAAVARELPDLEVGISYYVVEQQDGEDVLRELRIDSTAPLLFNIETDI